ncbi:MAG: CPBP family intramembrane metalloprotease [Candidatus Cloacimonetes bacterium]|nr:CPBP family intramembrane metalloprotease [Candidatus Cloacimonadota bacterium]MCF7813862.1 CPBP family intramembrane metalloprotease [Candidatus Cloacimonadota bacterium]MCF7868300.1 CPBP family intramembrane metalloprotease [Candidatus Cloacimonadota bacterium]MCF7883726.1 CPBP family intramembrane metalloprotease [Candidatus Cloacimonadota bacterium]
MNLKNCLEKRPVLSFWLLAIILAVLVIPYGFLVFTHFPNFGSDIDAVTEGKGYNTNILYSIPIALKVHGGIWYALILLLWPATASISALIISYILKKKQGLKELFSRFRFWSSKISLRKGVSIWLQAILLAVGINLVYSFLRNYVSDVETSNLLKIHPVYSGWEMIFLFITSLFFDGGGLMEEIGWRGFALPRLQKKWSPLKASIILGTIWSLWHIPVKLNFTPFLDFITFYFVFTLMCILYSIVITYFYNRLGGSILIGIAFHGLMNDSTDFKTIFNADTLEINNFTDTALLCVIFVAVVFFILLKEGEKLGKG